MELAAVFREFLPALEARFGRRLTPDQRRAIDAILRCRTPEAGEMLVSCPDCGTTFVRPHSCGHRSCPSCQHQQSDIWLDRQGQKLLPVPYFLVTFTIPSTLRVLARQDPRMVYDAMFKASADALRCLGKDPRFLGGQIGMTGVLHTNTRRLGFHPHIHYLIPGGAIDYKGRQWRRKDWNFLFPERALARIFRAKLLDRLCRNGMTLPGCPAAGDWVVNCSNVGSGEPALKYLSCYLYRGVIAEKRIVDCRGGKVTFVYRDGKSREWRRRTLPGEEFMWLVLQHVLPRGFRRARDCGFLHGNARSALRLIQLLLHARVPCLEPRLRPPFRCPNCDSPMVVLVAMLPRRAAASTGPPLASPRAA